MTHLLPGIWSLLCGNPYSFDGHNRLTFKSNEKIRTVEAIFGSKVLITTAGRPVPLETWDLFRMANIGPNADNPSSVVCANRNLEAARWRIN